MQRKHISDLEPKVLMPNDKIASQDSKAISRHEIASRYMDRVVENQDDDEMQRCCVAHD